MDIYVSPIREISPEQEVGVKNPTEERSQGIQNVVNKPKKDVNSGWDGQLPSSILSKVPHPTKPNRWLITKKEETGMILLEPSRYSVGPFWNGYRRILRITAYVVRFIRHCLQPKNQDQCKKVSTVRLHPSEISIARKRLIRISQKHSFKEEIDLIKTNGMAVPVSLPRRSRIRRFNPFIDAQGILRSRSRLEKTNIYGYDMIFPIILDRQDTLTQMIAQDAHFEVAHPVGLNAVKAKLQAEFIIIGMGALATSIKWRCALCQRNFGRPAGQLQAPLPPRRLGETRLRAFTDVGIDYAGPFSIVMGRGIRRKKIYILVMTCMATRAIHLEPTGGMDTTDVLNAISRFTDIRGTPISITSDNQTSFQKANQDLIDWIASIDYDFLVQQTQHYRGKGIQWFFNPPIAPHFGGVYEIMVKATKRALYATIGTGDLNEEDFRTAVSKVAWMLNQRPIQRTGDASDWQTLTPNHFINVPEGATFPPELPNTKNSLQSRLKHQIEVQLHFWKRFQKEIVPLLAPRSKWFQRIENLKEGDLIVEIDDNEHRGKWKLALIEKVFPSQDSFVRKVEIKDAQNRRYIRPINRLIPIRI